MKALVVMISRRLSTAHAVLTFLNQDEPVAQQWRRLLHEHGRCPTRHTWERQVAALPPHRPGLLGGFGRPLVAMMTPWVSHGRAAAIDRPPLQTSGGVWHKKHKEAGELPPTSIDPEAGWSKAGWHGWWYGWTWPLAVSVGAVWIPLAAELTPAKTAATEVAPRVLAPLPAEVRSSLGDTADHTPAVRSRCEPADRTLVATQRGPYPHHDAGVEVRRLFHQLRSQAIEPFNGLCKHVFAWRTQMLVKGLQRSQLLALGAIAIDQ